MDSAEKSRFRYKADKRHRTTPWSKEDHDFLVEVMKMHGPTLGDLVRFVVRGLPQDEQSLFFSDLNGLLKKYPLEDGTHVLDLKLSEGFTKEWVAALLKLPYP